jgi:type I restriction enzyme R subunit
MSFTPPSYLEKHVSQLPALRLLVQLGYTCLRPVDVHAARGNRAGAVILGSILEAQLRRINRIDFKGESRSFSDESLRAAVAALDVSLDDGLLRANERVLDLLLLGKSFEEEIAADRKSFTLRYVNWERPELNVFHVAPEMEIERRGSRDKCRLDLVLFVNGIPLAAIECKRPGTKDWPRDAIDQLLAYQRDDHVPQLFACAQLLLAVNQHAGRYGTIRTEEKFWSTWHERDQDDARLGTLINRPLSGAQKESVFADRFAYARDAFEQQEQAGGVPVSEQDRLIHSLCRPERLLELVQKFTVFDAGEKKIARHQQYFVVKNTLARVKRFAAEGRREGGVVWHTQGSGKSLTMVMLAKALALESEIPNPQIILVTDRIDLDRQIEKTFRQCGLVPVRAKTGKHLRELLADDRSEVVTTVLKKFESVVRGGRDVSRNPNLFVLVDEGHRSHYGAMHAGLRLALPVACYLGFTGTPLMHAEKNTALKFGGFIEPTYTIRDALADKAIVPLLYEGRHILQSVDQGALDKWFGVVSEPLSDPQKVALKRRLGTRTQLNEVESKLQLVAYDISEHFSQNLQGTGARGMVAVANKSVALMMKSFLDDFGKVTSEVVISAPERPEDGDPEDGYQETEAQKKPVQAFWRNVLERFGTEEAYLETVTSGFKHGESPELLIVVGKLLVGFDAPRNTVLYLCRHLEGHALLQAIARVNRLYEGKEFGLVIDYYGVIKELGEALDLYAALPEFDEADLASSLRDIADEIDLLRQRHSELLAIFAPLGAKQDAESCGRLLYDDEERRQRFYAALSRFSRTLALALSSENWLRRTPVAQVESYKRDFVHFQAMRAAIKQRCSEDIDHAEYEVRIRKLLNTHVKSDEVMHVTPLTNIHEQEKFKAEIDRLGSDRAKADTIASRIKRTCTEHMGEDPYFYRKFSAIIEEIIAEYRAARLTDAQLLAKTQEAYAKFVDRVRPAMPREFDTRPVARAFFGVLEAAWEERKIQHPRAREIAASAALAIDDIVQVNRRIDWTRNPDVQNSMELAIDDYLHDMKSEHDLDLDFDTMDRVIDEIMDVARARYA